MKLLGLGDECPPEARNDFDEKFKQNVALLKVLMKRRGKCAVWDSETNGRDDMTRAMESGVNPGSVHKRPHSRSISANQSHSTALWSLLSTDTASAQGRRQSPGGNSEMDEPFTCAKCETLGQLHSISEALVESAMESTASS
ncbi:hypothetical protein DPEC_G00161800 [Dallia pectoralis]|uniref:Uncharacterized protein n=1 Tax=Dallia pectoralis TaxID=75939 RepID=A0ACC2GG51_DALPE|nr:hypothetical protein DPEC_G00161800 [Dallia pectoralis]